MNLAKPLALYHHWQRVTGPMGSRAEILAVCRSMESNREVPKGLKIKLPRCQHSALWVYIQWRWEHCLAKDLGSYAPCSILPSSRGKSMAVDAVNRRTDKERLTIKRLSFSYKMLRSREHSTKANRTQKEKYCMTPFDMINTF